MKKKEKNVDHDGNDLPIGITVIDTKTKTGKNQGYKAECTINGTISTKCFTEKNLSMDEKLGLALTFIDEIKEQLEA